MFVEIVGSVIVALLAVHWAFPSILKIAKVKGLVDNPNARKLQKEPVPVLGGIAVFFGIVMGMLAYTNSYSSFKAGNASFTAIFFCV